MSGAGVNVGLSALVQIEPDDYIAYSKSFYGAYILVHGPRDFPQASVSTAVGQPGCDVTISVTPSVTVSQPRIRRLPLSKRNCLFPDEVRKPLFVSLKFDKCYYIYGHFLCIYSGNYARLPVTHFKRVLQSVR